MTIESLLRRRARRSRIIATAWICLAFMPPLTVYFTLPFVVSYTLQTTVEIGSAVKNLSGAELNPQNLTVITMILAVGVVCFASYLLMRWALLEIECAVRYSGLADALCISGSDFEKLEKSVALFVPRTKHLGLIEALPLNELKSLLEAARKVV